MSSRQSVSFGPFELDPRAGLKRGDRLLHLTPKALALLTELASRPGEVLSKEALFDAIWPNTAVSDAALVTCIQEIRHALRDNASRPRFIETVHRRGYRFVQQAGRIPPVQARPSRLDRGPMLIGRAAELGKLDAALSRASDGGRQIIFVSGDAGIGKTALVETFLAIAQARQDLNVAFGQCVERHEASEAYQPLLDALTRWGRQPDGKHLIAVLERHAPTWLAQMPSLLSPERSRQLARSTAGSTRERMLRELTEALETVASTKTLILVLEDLHWSDVSTVDWLAAFARRPEPAALLVLATDRPVEAIVAKHPLRSIKGELLAQGRACELVLSDLNEGETLEYVRTRFPPAPGMDEAMTRLAGQIHGHTEGRPLLLVSVADDLVAGAQLAETRAGWVLQSDERSIRLAVPKDVDRIVEGRLEHLNMATRNVLEAASVAGLRVSAAAAAAAAQMSVIEAEACCASIARSTQLIVDDGTDEWPDGAVATRFVFAHALYRDAIYRRIPAAHKHGLHHRIGSRLEEAFGARSGEIASELAMHFERGRDFRKAVHYLRKTGETAARRSASTQALNDFNKALNFLERLPPSRERNETEVDLRIASGSMHMAIKGWGTTEAKEAFARARALCESLGFPPRLFPALGGTWLSYMGQGALDPARELAEHLISLADNTNDSSLVLQAEHACWATYFTIGDLERAHRHTQAGIALYRTEQHAELTPSYGNHDAGVCCRMFAARTLALLGHASEARTMAEDAIRLAAELRHPFDLAQALSFAATVYQVLSEPQQAARRAGEGIALCRDHGFRFVEAVATAISGWAMAQAGDAKKGIALIRQAIEVALNSGEYFVPLMLGLLAEAQLLSNEAEEGLASVHKARMLAERTGERFYEAELLRLHGALLLTGASMRKKPRVQQRTAHREAERLFKESLTLGRKQKAHLFVLRTSLSLARMWAQVLRREEAATLLRRACAEMSHQPGLADLDEARALLAAWTS